MTYSYLHWFKLVQRNYTLEQIHTRSSGYVERRGGMYTYLPVPIYQVLQTFSNLSKLVTQSGWTLYLHVFGYLKAEIKYIHECSSVFNITTFDTFFLHASSVITWMWPDISFLNSMYSKIQCVKGKVGQGANQLCWQKHADCRRKQSNREISSKLCCCCFHCPVTEWVHVHGCPGSEEVGWMKLANIQPGSLRTSSGAKEVLQGTGWD